MAPEETRAPAPADPADAVRTFYESHPYPAPIGNLDRHRDLYRNPERRRALSFLLWPTEQPRANRQILVAGCGTSQAAIHALREPDAPVTAIDISETSLRHTRDLQRKYRLRNLDLHRLAIEQVGELGQTFDQIVCTGVLHHLPDPDIGLRSLRNVLAPNGAMHLMVYAAYGRAGIYMMQEYRRLLGVGATEEELRDLGTAIGALSPDHPIAGVARRAKDFGNPDALADALLHPQDRAFTVPQFCAWLERCGLSFGRWFDQAPYLPQCGAIARTPHAARLLSLSPPLQHAAVELLRGTMAKHNFIAYRDDRPGESQPIRFDGDAWRAYVPLRLPWTLCIRDRVTNQLLLNPVVSYHFAEGWSVGSSPNITANWIASGGKWTVPIGGGFGRALRLGEQAIKLDLDAGVKLPEKDRQNQPIIFDSYDVSPVLFGTGKSARTSWFYFTENELTRGAVRLGNYKETYAQYPQSESYSGPITLSQYERFQDWRAGCRNICGNAY
jgi:SAM-dependent methyltransferase